MSTTRTMPMWRPPLLLLMLSAALSAMACTRGPAERDVQQADLTPLLRGRTGTVPAAVSGAMAVGVVEVPLPRELVATIPDAFDDWLWASNGTQTLVIHTKGEHEADIVIWFEEELPLGTIAPALEMQRFYASVASNTDLSSMSLLATKLVNEMVLVVSDYGILLPPGTSDAVDRVRALAESSQLEQVAVWLLRAVTGTQGRGIGFAVDVESRSRWKVAGRNEQGAWIRLAETRGWRQQLREPILPSDDVTSFVRVMLPEVPVEALASEGEGDVVPGVRREDSEAGSGVQGDQATLLHGRVEHSGRATNLAILCVELPTCSERSAILEMLSSVRLDRGATDRQSRSDIEVSELAARFELHIQPVPGWADPVSMAQSWLERVNEVEQIATQLGAFVPNPGVGSGDAPSTESPPNLE